ncbi:MAG: exodeoxyribonuclease VII large subunit [Spirochaetaceae bacterium]|jgi:exodeoxyribonuclease VII large subunit|nr:exodeoxyribonuclease VII large subunit [Spirochaetaceae bacterium]
MFDEEKHCYSVSEVTASIKMLLEARFPQILMEGEISNFRPSSAGHCYFTLKDQQSMIQAVIFRNDFIKTSFKPADGMKVKVTGRITVYSQRGNYQIICSSLEEKGKGNILEILEERKRRLAAEGLFDSQFKKPLPGYPEKVAVITSPTGAAIRDIMQVLKRRNSSVQIRILPCTVQGDSAAAQITKMIETANRYKLGDLIILARGGGSLEDLLPFSEESVVRAISSSYIPVVTGIGHEIDFSLSDFVSDLRAATPSAAAELVCESSMETLRTIQNCKREMTHFIQSRITLIREKLKPFSKSEISLHFRRYLEPLILEIDDLKESMCRDISKILSEKKHTLEILKKELEGHSPFDILKKGYSFVTDSAGRTITDSKTVKKGELIKIHLASGKIHASVEEKE